MIVIHQRDPGSLSVASTVAGRMRCSLRQEPTDEPAWSSVRVLKDDGSVLASAMWPRGSERNLDLTADGLLRAVAGRDAVPDGRGPKRIYLCACGCGEPCAKIRSGGHYRYATVECAERMKAEGEG